jgi:hypothetical protein
MRSHPEHVRRTAQASSAWNDAKGCKLLSHVRRLLRVGLGMSLTDSENDRNPALIEKELKFKLHDEIELRSSPAGQAITITHRVPARRFWQRLFGLTDQVSTEIAVAQGRRRP